MNNVTPNKKQSAIALLALTGLCAFMSCRTSEVAATPSAVDAGTAGIPVADAGVPPASAPLVVPTTATITFTASPAVKATVSWGKKRLGIIAPGKPLVVVRPRDSGPLDVVVRAEGFLPVHTRAHTFSDTKVLVKLTPPDQTATLLGYRVPIDAGVPLGADGLPVMTDPAVAPLLAPPDMPMP
jgi:hypothetical protein